MKRGWQAVFDFLKYNRKDRLGLLILAFLTLLVWTLPYVWPAPEPLEFSWQPEEEPTPLEPFPFALDTVSAEQLQSMGLNARVAQNLIRYRDRGGVIRTKEKLLSIYGMDTAWWDQWHPVVVFPEREGAEPYARLRNTGVRRPFAASHPDTVTLKNLGLSKGQIRAWQNIARAEGRIDSLAFSRWNFLSTEQKEEVRPYTTFDEVYTVNPNEAGPEAWLALPGIGEKTAGRLVEYRRQLGGFTSPWQFTEVGLDSARVEELLPYLDNQWGVQQKLRINRLGAEELARHPYIRTSGAKRLVSYRETVGLFTSPREVGKVLLLDAHALEKLTPYLSFE